MFSQAGTYRELEKRIPDIKAQGIGIIWLMPITTRGVLKAFNSPYCVKDYMGFHAPFGSGDDFRSLVGTVHAQGLHLILDWVPNHTSWDNSLITDHPEFYKKDANGKIAQAYDWSDVAQLDYTNAGLRAWMIEAMKFWIKNYDVDGFRCDVAWGVPEDFWNQARPELDKLKPVFMLAESDNVLDQGGFDSNYDWDLMNVSAQTTLTDISKGLKPASYIDGLLAKEKGYLPGFMRMRFTSNHDEWNNFGTPFQAPGRYQPSGRLQPARDCDARAGHLRQERCQRSVPMRQHRLRAGSAPGLPAGLAEAGRVRPDTAMLKRLLGIQPGRILLPRLPMPSTIPPTPSSAPPGTKT